MSDKENSCSPKKLQKLKGQIIFTEQINVQKVLERVPLESIINEQKQFLNDHPITFKSNTSRLQTLESKGSRGGRMKTHSRQFNSGMSKFLEQNKMYKEKSLVPGPGSYETCLLRKSIKGGSFFKSPQYPSARKLAPGPGSYDTSKSIFGRRGLSIGKSKRKINNQNSLIKPGPAQYQIPDTNQFKSKTARMIFPKATTPLQTPKTPGPGAYISDLSTLSKRSALIKGRSRYSHNTQTAPGPVDYNPNYEAATFRRNSAFFTKPRVSRH